MDEIFTEYVSYGKYQALQDKLSKRKLDADEGWEIYRVDNNIKLKEEHYKFKKGSFNSGYTCIIMEEMIRENPEMYMLYSLKSFI